MVCFQLNISMVKFLIYCLKTKYMYNLKYYLLLILNRYGLPVNFVAIVMHPTRKSTKRLRDVLDQLFGYLDQSNKSKYDEVKYQLIFCDLFSFHCISFFSFSFYSKSTFLVCFHYNKNIIHMCISNWILIIST